jgi:hypothetical protein
MLTVTEPRSAWKPHMSTVAITGGGGTSPSSIALSWPSPSSLESAS